MFRKLVFPMHRRISVLIALPVILWALSGFLHPIMTNIRPKVATQFYQPPLVDTTKFPISIYQALAQNKIDSIEWYRLTEMHSKGFYQIKMLQESELIYISGQSGKILKNGDDLYARYLAKIFLEGQRTNNSDSINQNIDLNQSKLSLDASECCSQVTDEILLDTIGANIENVEVIQEFSGEYRDINRLLPVYKVQFDRPDGIRIYIETAADRFAYAVDDNRALADLFFTTFHNLGWLDFLGRFKYVITVLIMSAAFFTSILGLYIFFTTKSKVINKNSISKTRYYHRITSLSFSLFTLLFTFSGAFHAIVKLTPDTRHLYFHKQSISKDELNIIWSDLYERMDSSFSLSNIKPLKFQNKLFWQTTGFSKKIHTSNDKQVDKPKDLMKSMKVIPPIVNYYQANSYDLLPEGEKEYSTFLASTFRNNFNERPAYLTQIVKFEGEYGFVNKRLPVWKVAYKSNSNERYYVETKSGTLAAHINDKDLIEGYSFAILHKHHFMDWAGKSARDFSTMFWAGGVIAISIIGLILWWRTRK